MTLNAFVELGLDARLLRWLDHKAMYQPTPIQQQAIPVALRGIDLIASSKTGSGKTLAYLLPALHRVGRQKALSKRDPRVLILAPTRELARQVYIELRQLISGLRWHSCLIVGGENFNDQSKALAKEPHFIVATPGRLVNHLDQGHCYLHGLELLILDEADRMLDLGFASALRQIHHAADHRLRQTLMFSATLEHAAVNEIAQQLLKKPHRVSIEPAYAAHGDIREQFIFADNVTHKEALLLRLLDDPVIKQVMVFTATRADTLRLQNWLAEKQISVGALNADMNQSQRNQEIVNFSAGRYRCLVCTDLGSRGLDLPAVSHVINFDLPKHPEEYIHRIGRTGRAGEKGEALSLVGPKDSQSLKKIQALLKRELNYTQLAGLEATFAGEEKPKKPAGKSRSKTPKKPATSAKKANKPQRAKSAKPKRQKTAENADGFAPFKGKNKN